MPSRLLAALLIALLFATGCSRSPRQAALPPGSVVLALGDSVTFGTGAGAGEGYPARLAGITGWEVHNRGVPGDTSAGALERLGPALEETRPALVIVEIGGNAELAQEEKVPLVPKIFAQVLDDPGLKSDQIHPNAAGYRRLAEGIAAGLRDTGLLAAR